MTRLCPPGIVPSFIRFVTIAASVPEPTFDSDGYPTQETLDRIATWPIVTFADMAAAMDYAGRAWTPHHLWRCQARFRERTKGPWKPGPKRRYVFSTGGWSGNESIVAAIERNDMLQTVGAYSWRRGGHYEYRFPVAER